MKSLPNGIDIDRYTPSAVHAPDLQGVKVPLAGFVGMIDHRIDVVLIKQVARLLPGWTFVMVGPATDPAIAHRPRAEPNIRVLGNAPHPRVPQIASHWTSLSYPPVCPYSNRTSRASP